LYYKYLRTQSHMPGPIGSLVYVTKPKPAPKYRDTTTVTLLRHCRQCHLKKFTLWETVYNACLRILYGYERSWIVQSFTQIYQNKGIPALFTRNAMMAFRWMQMQSHSFWYLSETVFQSYTRFWFSIAFRHICRRTGSSGVKLFLYVTLPTSILQFLSALLIYFLPSGLPVDHSHTLSPTRKTQAYRCNLLFFVLSGIFCVNPIFSLLVSFLVFNISDTDQPRGLVVRISAY